MKPGMWYQIELPEITEISGVVLDAASSRNDYPRGCDVEFSADGKNWSNPINKEEEKASKITVDCPTQKAKFIKITQTGKNRLHWSIHDLHVLKAAEKK